MIAAWLPTKRTKRPCSKHARYFERNGFGSDGAANLYDHDFDDTLLGRTVGQLRAELGLDRGTALISLSLPVGLLAAAFVGIVAWSS